MPFLELSIGGKVFPLRGGELVGRHRSCAIRLLDAEVSRRHARIVRLSRGRFAIEDAGSSNGVRLNGETLEGVTRLAHGDVLEIGALSLRYVERPTAATVQSSVVGWDDDADWDDEETDVQTRPHHLRRRRRAAPELPAGSETEEQLFPGKRFRPAGLLGNAPVGLFSPDSPEALLHNQRAFFPAGLVREKRPRRA